jgi:DNA repair ATPase RecN
MSENYAKFWKCALQVNPWSYNKEYQGADHGFTEDEYNKAIAEKCQKNGIQVVGIADHGSVDGLEKLEAALTIVGVVVFPGFEISSAEKVHMVCLYPTGTSTTILNQYLGALTGSAVGPKTAPSPLGCLSIADLVTNQGGVWYAAHSTADNGVLRLNQDGGGLSHIWSACDKVLAAQIPADIESIAEQEVRKILANKNAQYKRTRPIALLNAKDVRSPVDIDSLRCYSWVKMTTPTLDALRLAFRDAESRVRLSHEINPAYYSRIESVKVFRGYLADFDVSLSPNLNALVGGRGTGKSTLVEAIRYVLQLIPSNKDTQRVHSGIIEANFSGEKAGIEIVVTSFQHNSERYKIARYYGEQARVLDENGTVLQLSPKDILPRVEVYGQNELLAIIQDERAKAQLLRRFLPDDTTVRNEISILETELSENRDAIGEQEVRINEITTKLDQLPVLVDQEKSFKKLGIEKELEQVKARETQNAYVEEVGKSLDAQNKALKHFRESINAIEIPDTPNVSSIPYPERLAELSSAALEVKSALSVSVDAAQQAMDIAKENYLASKTLFDQSMATDEYTFNNALNTLPALRGKSVAQLTTEYKKVSGEIAKLKPLTAQKTQVEVKLLALTQERVNMLERLSTARSNRLSALTKAIKTLNKRLDGQLRIEFEPERNRELLKEYILQCGLEGVADKRLAWIDSAETLTIPDLVLCIRQGSSALQARFKKDGMQKQAADALAGLPPSRIREIEELELPERIELLLNVSREGETFREVNRLSTGQQCTAVLHLLLLDNRDPLIIDQPEDNLDNAFIADHIVTELRKSKTKRQFIFATHNANIPVFGDAEWIGVLHEQDGHATLQASGSIDAPEVKNLAANILEGGKEAFNRRREKYGL